MSKANEELSNDVKEAVRIMTDTAGHVILLSAKVDDITGDTKDIKLALFGDNNGHKGVIRKLDSHDAFYNLVKWAGGVAGALFIAHMVGTWLNATQPETVLPPPPPVIVVTATPIPVFREPTMPAEATQSPKQRYEPTDRDIDALAALCTVEVRDMLGVRDTACLSVIGTVMRRVETGNMSDRTIIGTITRGCFADSDACQFPAHGVWGCDGIQARACATSYPTDITHFQRVAESYFEGARGVCDRRLFYGIKQHDLSTCIIQATNGLWTGFHD